MDEKKFQRFNIVVQKGNEIFEHVEEAIKNANPLFYAYIRHEPDEEHDNDHYHIVIDFGKNKGKTYIEVHELFPHCHEEDTKMFNKSCAYLTHEDESSKQQKKRTYSRDMVFTNDRSLYNAMANSGSLETFDTTLIGFYIEQGTDNYIKFCERFGVVSVQPYMVSIKEYLTHYDCNERIKTNTEALIKCNLIYQVISGMHMSDNEKVLRIEQLFNHGTITI